MTAAGSKRIFSFGGACERRKVGCDSAMDFDWLLPREEMHALGEPPQHGDFALPGARIIESLRE